MRVASEHDHTIANITIIRELNQFASSPRSSITCSGPRNDTTSKRPVRSIRCLFRLIIDLFFEIEAILPEFLDFLAKVGHLAPQDEVLLVEARGDTANGFRASIRAARQADGFLGNFALETLNRWFLRHPTLPKSFFLRPVTK